MEFRIEARPYTDPDVVRLVAEVQAVYVTMYGGPDDAVVDVDEFVPPHGVMLVGLHDGDVVAMGGWRRVAAAVPSAEVKRMYVSPRAQRRGLARALLAAVEASAADAGITRIVLNTGPHQHAAIALYRAEGYEPSEPFGYYATHGEALFFAKTLPAGIAADG